MAYGRSVSLFNVDSFSTIWQYYEIFDNFLWTRTHQGS